MAAKKPTENVTITINPPKFKTIIFRLTGTTPLHCNQMDEDTRQKLIKKAGGSDVGGVKAAPKSGKSQFNNSIYRLPENSPYRARGYEYGFPGRGIKKALVEAGRLTDIDMVRLQQLIRVKADMAPIVKGEPIEHAEIINKPKGGSCASIRARFDDWEILVPVAFLEGAKGLTEDAICSLFTLAGETVGLGCGRTIRGGTNGAFEATPEDIL